MYASPPRGTIAKLKHICRRRQALLKDLDPYGDFEGWAETCVPSYCHANFLAAGVSWLRLFAAAHLAEKYAQSGPILDFGASIGELRHLLPVSEHCYSFIEQDDRASAYLQKSHPDSIHQTLDSAPDSTFACVFALDSLEHNKAYADLVVALQQKLRPDGCLIVSGPTENWLYRFGRLIAGFEADYHEATIDDIEKVCQSLMTQTARVTVPLGVPLFHLSVWKNSALAVAGKAIPPALESR